MKTLSSLIPGANLPDRTLEVVAPYDQTPLARIQIADHKAIEQALTTAHQCFQNRSKWLCLSTRLTILERLVHKMEQNLEGLTREAAQEGGKPYQDSKVEVVRAIDGVKLCIETLRGHAGEVIPMGLNPASQGKYAFTQKEPIGVVVAISAFNHPLNLIVHQVAPAIAAGCPVIVKPASTTPLSCFQFVTMLHDSGLPAEWCQLAVIDDNALATQLVTDARVGFLSFIGSARVGWMLRSKLAPGTRCALEHGGVAPVIVAEDADLTEAVPKLAKGGFYHAGQVCVSVQRVYVHERRLDELAQALVTVAESLTVGDPLSPDTQVGPLITAQECQRVDDWVQQAIEAGAKCLTGGQKLDHNCYACTVLLDPPETTDISCKEVFGPVILLYPFRDMEDAIQRANRLPVAFQAAVFTESIAVATRAYQQLNASAVMINDHTAFRVDWMPFAGLKESGQGIGGIPYTIEDMQTSKLLVLHHGQPL